MLRLVILIATLALAPLVRADAARAQVSAFTLDNGLEVVVIEDDRAPVVVHMVWYKIGAADEPQGMSGVAHFLEHLMFKGTEAYGPGAFEELVRENGGEHNAFTSWDYTAYFQRIAADRLDLVMGLEADRMTGLVLDEAAVASERGVVLEERNARVESNPAALFSERWRAQLFAAYPYRYPVIGWTEEIAQLTREEALAFYRAHYAPDRAVLVVAGDVTADEVRMLAETHYGPLAPSGAERPERPEEPPAIAARRLVLEDPRVGQRQFVRAYRAPTRRSGAQEEAAALSSLSGLLGNGATSLLSRRLELEQTIATSTGTWYGSAGMGPQEFVIWMTPAEDVSLEEAEAALDAVIAELLAEGPDAAELERLKTRARAARIYDLDALFGRAYRYGRALSTGLTVEDVDRWPEVTEAVTVEDVHAAARAILRPENSVTGWLRRSGEAG